MTVDLILPHSDRPLVVHSGTVEVALKFRHFSFEALEFRIFGGNFLPEELLLAFELGVGDGFRRGKGADEKPGEDEHDFGGEDCREDAVEVAYGRHGFDLRCCGILLVVEEKGKWESKWDIEEKGREGAVR